MLQFFRKPYFLGVDFGTSYIKAVELTLRKDQPVLVNYGFVELPFTEGKNVVFPSQSSEQLIRENLTRLIDRMKPLSKAMSFALPGYSGLITLLELPDMNDKDLEQAIQFEARKYIPSPLEDVAFSWEVISRRKGEPASPRKSMEVLLVAALKREVAKYERYVSETRLETDLLELEMFPLVRSIVGDRTETILIVDIGSRATNIVLVRDASIRLNYSLNAGGNEITSILSEGLNISWGRAEELKRGTKDFLNIRESALVFPALQLITREMTRIFETHAEQNPSDGISEIILSGGTAKMQGLPLYFSNLFHVPVSIADPWRNIFCEDSVRAAVSKLGPSFAIAVGLALGGVDRYRKRS